MSEINIILSKEAENCPLEAVQTLIEAARDIASSSDADFSKLKEAKWYKRLWNFITFSKENEILMARGVSNLAKLQEIVMKALVLLSAQTAELSEITKEHSELIDVLCQKAHKTERVQISLIRELRRIASGVDIPLAIEKLPQLTKIIVLSSLAEVAKEVVADEMGQDYLYSIFREAQCSVQDVQMNFNHEYIEELKNKEVQLLYQLIMEYLYVVTGDFKCDCEILDYISINRKKANAIENQIRFTSDLLGKRALLHMTNDEDLSIVTTDYLDLIEEKQVEEAAPDDEVVYDDEYEPFAIDTMVQIGEGERVKYKNKEITLKSLINCRGTLEFEHCAIAYNEGEFADEITLSGTATLTAKDCTFICCDFDDHPFITLEDGSSAFFDNCLFEGCSVFLDADCISGSVKITNSYLRNCERKFLVYSSVYGSDGSCCLENINIKNDRVCDYHKVSKNNSDWHMDVIRIRSGNLLVNEVFLYETPEYHSEIQEIKGNLSSYSYFSLGEGRITNSTFIGLSQCVSALNIENCKFETCTSAVATERSLSYRSLIQNCVFENCTDTIVVEADTDIKQCKFISNVDSIIKGATSSSGVNIEFCEFINTQNRAVDKYQGTELSDPMASITLNGWKNRKRSRIYKCIFDGVDIAEGFLIKSNIYENPSGYVLEVVDCDFRHCVTKRKSNKVIKTFASYYGTFGKQKSVSAVMIENCRGLDRINQQGNARIQTENIASIELVDGANVGSKIAKGLGLATAFALGGPAGVAGFAAITGISKAKALQDQEMVIKAAKE